MWCEPEPGKSSFNLACVSTLSMLEMVSVQILYRESDLHGTVAYGGHAWRSYINFPFFPFGICY